MMPLLSSNDSEHPWFAVQVRAGREQASAQHLRVRGYEAFLPCYEDRRVWSDRVRRVERALFAGYVFCRLSPDVLAHVITAPGVIRIVGDGQRAVPIDTEEIERLRQIVSIDLPREPWPFVDVGERVRIEAGPLKGVEGIVMVVKNAHRLIASVTLLQRSVAVEIDQAWVTSCHPSKRPAHVIAG
jgi:transcription antitermination factor NusG